MKLIEILTKEEIPFKFEALYNDDDEMALTTDVCLGGKELIEISKAEDLKYLVACKGAKIRFVLNEKR